MIETYWNEVFGRYKTPSGSFEILGMPEPLMSAHFGVRNFVGAPPAEVSQKMTLCVFAPTSHLLKSCIERQTLQEAIDRPLFWETQSRLNPQALDFIQRLLPFLSTLSTPHYHYYLTDQEQIIATAIVGVAECGCFLFNLVVDGQFRQLGIGQQMLKVIQNDFSQKKTFYWTQHEWFTSDAEVQTPLSLINPV